MKTKFLLFNLFAIFLNFSLLAQLGTINRNVTTDFVKSIDDAYSFAIQSDGKIVVAGESNSGFAMVRYNSDLSLDNTFGSGGKVITDFRGASESAELEILIIMVLF